MNLQGKISGASLVSLTITMLAAVSIFASVAQANTFVVANTSNSGPGSLAQAIVDANANPGADIITFNIPGSGVHTISPVSPLPTITDPVTIDGYTQPGASANSLAQGSNAVLQIELSGAAANSAAGLSITAGNSTIRGLVINRFNLQGINIQINGGNVIAGNYIGTDALGATVFPKPNNGSGVAITSPNNTIGGASPADRNVIAGNGNASAGNGISINTASAKNNKVIGNYIGTNATGMAVLSNFGNGVLLASSSSTIIGGTTASERNVITGFSTGISLNASGSNQIMGNYIGTLADGTKGYANDYGVSFGQASNNNTLGGTTSGSANLIAWNRLPAVIVVTSNNNAILGNSIHDNPNYLGIDLYTGSYAVTPNDDNTGDADSGANNLQNFPVLTSVVSLGGITTIAGTLDSAAVTLFRVEFFSNKACDLSGFGEGDNYLGFTTVTTDANGKGSFVFDMPTANAVGSFFTATATDPAGNTSEFSACASGVVASPGTLQLSTNFIGQFENDGSFNLNVTRTNGSAGTVSVNYATADGTAKAPDDYTTTSGTLVFANGETSKSISIPIIDNNVPEGTHAFTISLSNPTGGAVLGSVAKASLSIQDNDYPTVSISDVSQAEGNSGTTAFTFTVTSSNPIPNDVSVNYTTADGTGTVGSDYQFLSGTLTIPPGQTSKTVTIMVVGDTTPETDDTFLVNLSGPNNAVIGKAKGTGTILNDDGPLPAGTLQFNSASYSVDENAGQATITVSRTGGSSGAVSVQYASVIGGTATEGSDYISASGTLNWADGDTGDKIFAVTIASDSLNEPSETINLSLSNPTGGAAPGNASAVLTIADDDPKPTISINDVSQAEGNSGTTNFTFEVTLSTASGQTVTIDYNTLAGTAALGVEIQPVSGTLTFNPGETQKQVTVLVNGDTEDESDETFLVDLLNPVNATAGKYEGLGTVVNDDAVGAATVHFSQPNYQALEELGAITVTVTRSGDTSSAASVDYTTVDGSATQKADFEYTAGTLTFAPGEAVKTITLLLNEDAYLEGTEKFSVSLSNPSGAVLDAQNTATIGILDDSPESTTNSIDDAQTFVATHYHDFLNREPDPAGLAFWTNQIVACGNDAKCIDAVRINVSASFFLSIEHQETAYLLYLMQKESYATLPKYASFMRDLQEVSRGVVVNTPGWQQNLANNQQQLADEWVNRAEFKAVYDSLSNDAYVSTLYQNAGIVPQPAVKDKLVTALNGANMNRSAVLLQVAGDATFRQQEQNAAFVLMEYFGYLRRDPQATPDSDLSGYNFWLNKLNQFNGNYLDAEMIKAFTTSFEYRQRFGQ